jgi:hypothetical protein
MNRLTRIVLGVGGVLLVLVLVLGGRPAAGMRAQVQPEGSLPSSAPGGLALKSPAAAEPEPAAAEAYLRISGSALKPRDSDAEWASGADGGCIYVSGGNSEVVFNAPLSLTQGSTVTMLRMYVNDTSVESCIGWFTAYDWSGHIAFEWAVQSNTAAGETWFDVDIPDQVIDYGAYSYVVNWRPQDVGPGMQLCGFRIYYNPPGGLKYMPAVMRNR